jgi:hypothetical protein
MELNQISVETNDILVFRSNIDDKYKINTVCAESKKMDDIDRVNVELDDYVG